MVRTSERAKGGRRRRSEGTEKKEGRKKKKTKRERSEAGTGRGGGRSISPRREAEKVRVLSKTKKRQSQWTDREEQEGKKEREEKKKGRRLGSASRAAGAIAKTKPPVTISPPLLSHPRRRSQSPWQTDTHINRRDRKTSSKQQLFTPLHVSLRSTLVTTRSRKSHGTVFWTGTLAQGLKQDKSHQRNVNTASCITIAVVVAVIAILFYSIPLQHCRPVSYFSIKGELSPSKLTRSKEGLSLLFCLAW